MNFPDIKYITMNTSERNSLTSAKYDRSLDQYDSTNRKGGCV